MGGQRLSLVPSARSDFGWNIFVVLQGGQCDTFTRACKKEGEERGGRKEREKREVEERVRRERRKGEGVRYKSG